MNQFLYRCGTGPNLQPNLTRFIMNGIFGHSFSYIELEFCFKKKQNLRQKLLFVWIHTFLKWTKTREISNRISSNLGIATVDYLTRKAIWYLVPWWVQAHEGFSPGYLYSSWLFPACCAVCYFTLRPGQMVFIRQGTASLPTSSRVKNIISRLNRKPRQSQKNSDRLWFLCWWYGR